ncbi:DUF2970 domain-containing protein [Thalassotalea psychrophila]|uniref:DUF2970 domain-containing protein n=1 Tax=Thalassotalea psychrophila TaxID=3065647 RepID=A0ABY9TTE1_9GAMM|nr:DUF2970 domain-containing protein [Colwelliaceae bacterium SQ149]
MKSNNVEQKKNPCPKNEGDTSLKDVAGSVAAAFIGVQSEKNRQRDFSKGKFSHFVIVGLIGVVLFVGALVAIVSLVLPD